MPTVSIDRDELFHRLGKQYTDEEFDHLCFDFGIELDDVTTKAELAKSRDIQQDVEESESSQQTQQASSSSNVSLDSVIYRIDIPANRYDLLCMEGLSRALRVFLGLQKPPTLKALPPAADKSTRMTVKASTQQIRPFIVCAVMRDIRLDHLSYNSFLDLQDQLHRNLCRERSLVAIGTHDLDAVKGPFTYEALPPEQIRFVHLFGEEEMNSKEMLDWFRSDPAGSHIEPYTKLIYDSPVYPVVFGENQTVLSLPPIINGKASRISTNTTNVFVECTATDLNRANIVLNNLVAMFSEYSKIPFQVESVEVVYEDGGAGTKSDHAISSGAAARELEVTPTLESYPIDVQISEASSILGIRLTPEEITKYCEKMMLGPIEIIGNGETLRVHIPCTRADVLHQVDVIEDIGIAYGYGNIPQQVPPSHKPGKEQPINLLTDMLRFEAAGAGFTEILTFGLCSYVDNFDNMRRPENDGDRPVRIFKPKTEYLDIARTRLAPGLLQTLRDHRSLPTSRGFKIFECSDVTLLDSSSPVGARNERHIAALFYGPKSGFEIVHGLVDRIMQLLDIEPDPKLYSEEGYEQAKECRGPGRKFATLGQYAIVEEYDLAKPDGSGCFFPDRGAKVIWKPPKNNKAFQHAQVETDSDGWIKVGELGVLHPVVLKNFNLSNPCSIMELNLQWFV